MNQIQNRISASKMFLIIFLLALLTKSYGLTDHWKRNDHYNWGGVATHKAIECLNKIPFDVSFGRMSLVCDGPGEPLFANHSPAFLYPYWALTKLFGDHEWVYRLMPLFFSLLCLVLVYQIAREIWPDEPYRAVWVAFFQTFFLNMIYFGTHVDVIGELTTSLMLFSTLLAMRNQLHRACLFALFGGLTAWNGFLQFAGLLAYTWLSRKNFKVVLAWTVLAIFSCFGFLIFLKQSWDVPGFLARKIADPNYIETNKTLEKILWPVRFLFTFIQSMARSLGPLFATFVFYELFFGKSQKIWSLRPSQWKNLQTLSEYHKVLIFLFIGPGICLAMAPKYFMVHIFLFNFFIPFFSFLCANFIYSFKETESLAKKPFVIISILFATFYPYGVYKTNVFHDAINSVTLAAAALVFMFLLAKNRMSRTRSLAIIAVAALANFSQVIHYRNEKDTEFIFCESARKEFLSTNVPVRTSAEKSIAKEMYCKGIEIIYVN